MVAATADPQKLRKLHPVERHLDVLRRAYPQWRIWYESTPQGLAWRAVPAWEPTVEQVAAGVLPRLQRWSPVDLMADLSDQMKIFTGPRA
jgi:hypothetical protein